MKKYYKEENGKKVWLKNILKVDGKQIINPTEEQILEAGYVKYTAQTQASPTEDEQLTKVKDVIINAINVFDSSANVNQCTIIYGDKTIPYWASKSERNDLKTAVNDYINAGYKTYRLDIREKGISVEIPCEILLKMLSTLEVYAVQCYNKTTDHIFAIKAMNNKNEMNKYDYTVGYPNKPIFNLNGESDEDTNNEEVNKGNKHDKEIEKQI